MKLTITILCIVVLLILYLYISSSKRSRRNRNIDPVANSDFSWGYKAGKCRTIADKTKWIEYRDVVDSQNKNFCWYYFCDKNNNGPFEPTVCGLQDAPAKYMGCYLHDKDGQKISGDDSCIVPKTPPPPTNPQSRKLTKTSRMCNMAWSNTIGHLDKLHTLVQPSANDSVVLLDGFDASASDVAKWKNQGKIVIGYISVGSWEDWRPDVKQWPLETIGPVMDHWPREKWLNLSNWQKVQPVMTARLNMLKQKGFDGYEGDNISVTDQFKSKSSQKEFADENIAYAKWIASAAHSMGMLAILKNADEYASALQPYYDGAIKEEAIKYDEWDNFYPFLDNNKPVWIFEYPGEEGDNLSDELIDQRMQKAKQKIADKKIRATQILYETRKGYVTLL